jgi:hypothetical protein
LSVEVEAVLEIAGVILEATQVGVAVEDLDVSPREGQQVPQVDVDMVVGVEKQFRVGDIVLPQQPILVGDIPKEQSRLVVETASGDGFSGPFAKCFVDL